MQMPLHHSARSVRRGQLLAGFFGAVTLVMYGIHFPAAAAVDDQTLVWLRDKLGYDDAAVSDGQRVEAVRALRQLRDPALRSVFEDLQQRTDPRVRRQALLGLAELEAPPGLRLNVVSAAGDRYGKSERAALLSVGLDEGLIDPRDSAVMLGWPALEPGVKLMLAVELLKHGNDLGDRAWLHDQLRGLDEKHAALSALLLHHVGDPAGSTALQRLIENEASEAPAVALLLQTTLGAGLESAAPFALSISERTEDPGLRALALRVALGFGAPGAGDLWEAEFQAAGTNAERIRWALLALRALPGAPPEVFERIAEQDDLLLRAIGAIGVATANNIAPEWVETCRALYAFNHPVASAWLLHFARQHAAPRRGVEVFRVIVTDFRPGDPESRQRRLDEVMVATQAWIAMAPETAGPELTEQLRTRTGSAWREAVLLGLLRDGAVAASRILRDLEEEGVPGSASSRMLRALLIARHAEALDDGLRQELILAARGAGGLGVSLRTQAAWLLVRHGDGVQRLRSAASSP